MALVRGRPPLAVRAAGVDMPSGGRRVGASAAEVRQMSLMYATCAVHEYVKLLPCRHTAQHPEPTPGQPNVCAKTLDQEVCSLGEEVTKMVAHGRPDRAAHTG